MDISDELKKALYLVWSNAVNGSIDEAVSLAAKALEYELSIPQRFDLCSALGLINGAALLKSLEQERGIKFSEVPDDVKEYIVGQGGLTATESIENMFLEEFIEEDKKALLEDRKVAFLEALPEIIVHETV